MQGLSRKILSSKGLSASARLPASARPLTMTDSAHKRRWSSSPLFRNQKRKGPTRWLALHSRTSSFPLVGQLHQLASTSCTSVALVAITLAPYDERFRFSPLVCFICTHVLHRRDQLVALVEAQRDYARQSGNKLLIANGLIGLERFERLCKGTHLE